MVVCSAPGQAGEGEGNSFSNDKERLALCLMRGALCLADSKWPLTRAVDTSQDSSGQKGFGALGLLGWKVGPVHFKEKNPMPHPVTCHIPPSCTALGGRMEILGVEVTKVTLWVGLRKLVHKDKRKDSTLLERTRLCLGEPGEPAPQPRGQAGELQGWGSGALPHTHGQGPPEVQVQEVLHLVGDLKPKALADHHMPGGAELLVHCLLDHLCSTLEGRGCQSGAVTGTH